MKKLRALLGAVCGAGVGLLVAAGPVMATDLPTPPYKAPMAYKAPSVPEYNWSGFYLGVTAGGGMAGLPVTDMDDTGPFLKGPTLKSGGAIAGVHAGYNWQFSPSFLVGIEGDFNWASFKASDTSCSGPCVFSNLNLNFPMTAASKLNEISTLRGRLGPTMDRTLLYVTAGPAWGHINASLTEFNCLSGGCEGPNVPAGQPFATAADSSFHIGVALGAGVEYALTQNWIFRGEFLLLDFAGKNTTFVQLPSQTPMLGIRANSTATAEIARLGVSYKIW